jgi:lipoprotein-anchoring transpeptidase ErfK/SrfK
MRMSRVAAGLIIYCAAVSPGFADQQLAFAPGSFQMFGGLGDGSTAPLRQPSLGALAHKIVSYSTAYEPGSIIVETASRRLYFVLPGGEAIEYEVGVGREGFAWSGVDHVSRKAEWPDWRPPREMIAREAENGRQIPDFVAGGPDNPLGARAIYIGDTEFRIHGTTQPWTIGQAVSSGCIRMMNEEVIDLYDRVKVGALVVVE